MSLPNVLPDQLVTNSDYLQYLENIAYGHVDIMHSNEVKRFYTRFNDIAGTKITYPLMLIVQDDVQYPGSRDALFECFSFDIWILKSLGLGDQAKMDLLINECKVIMDDIIARIEYDSAPNPGGAWFFKYFKINEHTQWAINSPLNGDKQVGYAAKVVIGNQKRFWYDEGKWR
jgi:hypothetical protein